MSPFPIISWAASWVIGLIIYVIVGTQVEKSGEERLGATGSLFATNPEAKKKKS